MKAEDLLNNISAMDKSPLQIYQLLLGKHSIMSPTRDT